MFPVMLKLLDLFLNLSSFSLITYNFILKICHEIAKPIVFCLYKIASVFFFQLIESGKPVEENIAIPIKQIKVTKEKKIKLKIGNCFFLPIANSIIILKNYKNFLK
jgi:hypothetical protein